MIGRVKKRFSRINLFTPFEMKELPNLLMPGEQVLGVLSGFYSAGTAVLCATTFRLLLVDKKVIRMNIEDIRYESISEIDYSQQLFIASTKLYFSGRELQFRTFYRRELRALAQFIQNKMFEARAIRQAPELPYKMAPQVMTNTIATNNPGAVAGYTQPSSASIATGGLGEHISSRFERWRQAQRLAEKPRI